MNITDFFSNFSTLCRYDHPVICFLGKSYQPMFLQKTYDYMQELIGEPIQKLSLDQDLSEIQIRLATTFLGKRNWYCFDNLYAISSQKKREAYIRFIANYKGPHRIISFISTADSTLFKQDGIVSCSLQEVYTSDQVKQVPILYDQDNPAISAYFFSKLYRLKKEYSLEQLCLLQEYAKLLGKNMNVFFQEWIDKLIVSDVSLFHMSQLFFEKSSTEFFVKWKEIRGNYSDQFWTTFFSEQLFKAYFYIQHGGHVPTDQKQLLFGLSFSFLKHDWKVYDQKELALAHQKIYNIDLSLKQGGSVYQLDAFLASFFAGLFST